MIGTAAGAVDRAVVAAIHARGARDRARAETMTHEARLEALDAIYELYRGEHLVESPSSFFAEPTPIAPTLVPVRKNVHDAAWASTFSPWLGEVREKYLARVENRTARARLFTGVDPLKPTTRPAVIAVHGYMGGHWLLEEATWPIPWLMKLGLDVALVVLPFHALRAGPRRGAPNFPSADPRMTNEGFGQAVFDIGALESWLRARGAPHVGIMGVSLGGYTSSLVATIRPVDFVMPMIPLASIADFAREQGRLGDGAVEAEQHAALERANRVVSPLARPLKVAATRALVVAAEHDRITPQAHARRIATHFGCALEVIPGGHLFQVGRASAFKGLARMLAREGIIAPRR